MKSMKDKLSAKRIVLLSIVSILLVLTLSFIWGNSFVSMENSASESGKVYATLKPFFDFVFGKDVITHNFCRKLAHATEFMVLAFEIAGIYAVLNRYNVRYLETVSYGLFVAVIDESIQLISNRGSQVKDVLIDYFGYIVGIVCSYLLYLIIMLLKKRKVKE